MADLDPIIGYMDERLREWQAASDDRALFLNCYLLMTRNMLAAIQRREFGDGSWVYRLLTHFAGYYFSSLQAYENGPAGAPMVWRHAFDNTRDPRLTPLQKLLLGVNAHINYDLVLALQDLLQPEWGGLTDLQRAERYTDHCRVNQIIARTIDAVQDQVLEPAMPILEVVDRLLGPLDEGMIARLLARWREEVWLNAMRLLNSATSQERAELIGKVEASALQIADALCGRAAHPARPG